MKKMVSFIGGRYDRKSLLFVFLAVTMVLSLHSSGFAQQTKLLFNIPAQSLRLALDAFASQTDISLVHTVQDGVSVKTQLVSGQYTPNQALELMLKDTGYSFKQTSDATIAIKMATDAQPVAVNGEPEATMQPVAEQAQEKPNPDKSYGDYILEDTVVTATKTGATNIQDTAMSITAYDVEQINNTHSTKLTDLSQYIPNVQIEPYAMYTIGYIRGVGTKALENGGEQNVAFYLDGVYLDKGYGAGSDFFDVQRVEVLRGPQGTLYGRNATGGAINIITKEPSDELELKFGLEVGNFNKRRVDAAISGPIVKDKIKARFSISNSEHDGYIKNIVGPDLMDQDFTGVRGVIQFTPTDNVDIRIGGDYQKKDEHIFIWKLLDSSGGLGAAAAAAGIPASTLIPGDFWTVSTDAPANDELENWGISANVTIDLPNDMTLRSTTAFRKYERTYLPHDMDGSLFDAITITYDDRSDQFSQELQLNANWSRFKWILGLFYYCSEQEWPLLDLFYGYAIPGWHIYWSEDVKTDAWAGFGSLTYAITDKLNLTTGLRYSYEEKDYIFLESHNYSALFPYGRDEDLSDSWDDVSPKFQIDYRLNDDAFFFAMVTKGFRSGGFARNRISPPTIDQEILWSYEAGFKTDWFNDRLRINGSAFYYNYEDMVVNAVVNIGSTGDVEFQNAAES
ncbi:MAG: TonB-dependent receptor, partial [Deltaproteobacteria bacterium]|nr:TonB-dependent receptor [Deltaproteobacteria bacterium]